MLEKLFSIFSGKSPGHRSTADFTEMMSIARGLVLDASEVYWGKELSPEARTELYSRDVKLNKLERDVRVSVVAQLASPVASDVPYGLLIMSLVKDVERLGDYAKNLTEVARMSGVSHKDLPDDEVLGELAEIRRSVDKLASEAASVYASADRDRAQSLTVEGRSVAKRCDKLVERIAKQDYSAAVAVNLTLATRFYKRIQGHLLNLLSSVIMPLHKLDYYDETAVIRD